MANKRSFVVIGMGRFGRSIAKTLYSLGHEVLVLDNNAEQVQEISEYVTHAVEGDCQEEAVLRGVGVKNFDVAVVAIGQDMEASILVTVMLKELGVAEVVAKAQSVIHAKILSKVGADRVIFPERDMGVRMAHILADTNFMDYIELADDYSIAEVACPAKWAGKTLGELDVRAAYGVNVMVLKTAAGIDAAPQSDTMLHQGDTLVIVGDNDHLVRVQSEKW